MPKRIQRKRVAGWRMPEGVVYVGRPTKWGNPTPAECYVSAEQMLADFEGYCTVQLEIKPFWLVPLRGKDLACWCALDKPCHADVLLRLANDMPPQ